MDGELAQSLGNKKKFRRPTFRKKNPFCSQEFLMTLSLVMDRIWSVFCLSIMSEIDI